MRILITGSRNWLPAERIWWEIYAACAESDSNRIYIVHGGCPSGADAMANVWCSNNPAYGFGTRVIEEIHRPDWESHDRLAGFMRNESMVDDGADLCLAFIAPCTKAGCGKPQPHGSHGATHCAGYAEKQGVEVRRFAA